MSVQIRSDVASASRNGAGALPVAPEAATHLSQRESYVLSTAETAECCCPDACERDHANE